MWSFDRKNGLTLLTRNGMPDEEIIGLEKSNNVNCIKKIRTKKTKLLTAEEKIKQPMQRSKQKKRKKTKLISTQKKIKQQMQRNKQTHLDDSLKKINLLHKENTSMKQKYTELKNSFEQEKLSSQNCKCEADTLRKEVSDLKKKLGNIFKENKELKEDINKRKLASVTDFCASNISVDLNPSPRKKLCTENKTDKHDGKRKGQMNEENTEYKNGEKVLCFWKQDQNWYEADIIEKRSKAGCCLQYNQLLALDNKQYITNSINLPLIDILRYFVKFVLDGVERVLKQKDIKKKKTGKR